MSAVPPGFPLDPIAAPGFQEPTRRHLFSGRFDYSGRYAASLATVIFATYLQVNTNFGLFIQGVLYDTGYPQSTLVLLFTQTLLPVVAYVFAFLIAPTTPTRRFVAAGLAVVILLIWALLTAGRLGGSLPPIGGPMVIQVFIAPAGAGVFVALLGWLIVRERSPLSYLVLLLTPLLGIVALATAFNGVDSGTTQLLIVPLAAVIGIGGAWAARGLSTLTQRTAPAYPAVGTQPVPPSTQVPPAV